MTEQRVTSHVDLVISDIDGTLLTSNHELTDNAKSAAHKLAGANIMLALASSRPPRAIEPIAVALKLDVPFGAFNGSLIVAGDRKTIIAESSIDPATVHTIKDIASEFKLEVWLYDESEWWVSERTSFVDREEHTAGFKALLDGYSERLSSPLNKLTVVGVPEQVAEAEKRVLNQLGQVISASRSKPRFLDITPYGWHKGSVVSRFATMFKVAAQHIATIGDGPNDVEMFRCSGMSIAMGQAVEAVKSHAQFVTTTNDDDGWAHAILKYVLGKDSGKN